MMFTYSLARVVNGTRKVCNRTFVPSLGQFRDYQTSSDNFTPKIPTYNKTGYSCSLKLTPLAPRWKYAASNNTSYLARSGVFLVEFTPVIRKEEESIVEYDWRNKEKFTLRPHIVARILLQMEKGVKEIIEQGPSSSLRITNYSGHSVMSLEAAGDKTLTLKLTEEDVYIIKRIFEDTLPRLYGMDCLSTSTLYMDELGQDTTITD